MTAFLEKFDQQMNHLGDMRDKTENRINRDFREQNNAAEQLSQLYYNMETQSAQLIYEPMQSYLNTTFAATDVSRGKAKDKLSFIANYFKWFPKYPRPPMADGITPDLLKLAAAQLEAVGSQLGYEAVTYEPTDTLGIRINTNTIIENSKLWSKIAKPYIDKVVEQEGGLGLLDSVNDQMSDVDSIFTTPYNSASDAWNNLTDKQKNDFISATPLTSAQIRTMQNSSDPTVKALANKVVRGRTDVGDYVDYMDSIENIRQDFVDAAPEKYVNNYNLALAREDDLTDKAITAKVLDKEADNIKYNLEQMKQIGINKMRSAEINTYYAEKYREQVHLVKMLIVIGVCILLLVILNKKGIISGDVSIVLIAIVIVLGTIAFGSRVYNYYRRDNMNYQEFEYGYDSDIEEEEEYDDSIIKTSGKFAGKFCYMDDCCSSGMYYDGDIGKCVDGPAPEGNEQDGTTDADDEQDEDSLLSSVQDWGEGKMDEFGDSRENKVWS